MVLALAMYCVEVAQFPVLVHWQTQNVANQRTAIFRDFWRLSHC